MGTGASMLWWEEGFCRMLADACYLCGSSGGSVSS
jgi:hypothetical protein